MGFKRFIGKHGFHAVYLANRELSMPGWPSNLIEIKTNALKVIYVY